MIDTVGHHKRVWKRCMVLLILVGAFGGLWYGGILGGLLRQYMLPMLITRAPAVTTRRFNVHFQGLAEEHRLHPPELERGVQVTVSRAYVVRLLRDSPFPAWLVPPGLIKDGMFIFGFVTPSGDEPALLRIPLVIRIDQSAAFLPRLLVRFPVNELNAVLSEEFAEDWSEQGEYILGSYELNQRIWFHSIQIRSENAPREQPEDPVRFSVNASGRLRYWFDDGFISARLTADVPLLAGTLEFAPVVHDDGIGFHYTARVEALEIKVNRMAPWIERRLASKLAASIERSQNRRRKRERMARRRLPSWLPLDVDLEIEILPAATRDT